MNAMLHQVLPQPLYAEYLQESALFVKDFIKSLPPDERERFKKLKERPLTAVQGEQESEMRWKAAKQIIKARAAKIHLEKAGVTTALGYNFYDLRAPLLLAYPVNTPFRNSMPRQPRVNAGVGTAAHWQATRNFGTVYPGVVEGQRNSTATPDNVNYIATYKELGIERLATFTSQFAGEGYADNVADEHLRGLHQLMLSEEGILLCGNSGTAAGNNGFALGTAPTPTTALVAGGSIANATVCCVAVVILTALGNPNNAQYGYGVFPTVATGLTPSYSRTAADGSTLMVNGGMSAISAVSGTVTMGGGNNSFKATVAAVKGGVAYAWYVNGVDTTLANAKLAAITSVPTATFTALPAGGNQAGNAAGLNTDHSFNTTDFDGLLSYAFSTTGAYWKDLAAASLTSGKDGTVVEIEAALQYFWDNYQGAVNAIWCSTDTRIALDQAIRYSGTLPTAFRFDYARDGQNNLLGGYVVSAYQSKFAINPNGGNAIPINLHPMLPKGTIFFDISASPYPQSRAPFVRGLITQRDYYSIEWPVVTRQWTFGTYVHEVLQHNFPWLCGAITGVGAFVGN